MKLGGMQFWLALAAMFLFIAVGRNRAQPIPVGHATGFSSDMYYGAPDDDKVQMRLSGSEATPLPGGLLAVKEFQVEALGTNGATQMTAQAPNCTIAMVDRRADSAGHLKLRSGDGKYFVEGDGFLILWHEKGVSLTISNHVHTVLESGFLQP